MSRFRRAIALLLVALWLPAVTHCGMENLAASVDDAGCCSHEASGPVASEGGCLADHCGVFDDGHYRVGQCESLVLPPLIHPIGMAGDDRLVLAHLESSTAVQSWPSAPPDWVRRWAFEHRAAPLANAPGHDAG